MASCWTPITIFSKGENDGERLGKIITSQCKDAESWMKVRALLDAGNKGELIDAILVIPPWIDGDTANVIGLNLKNKEAPDGPQT